MPIFFPRRSLILLISGLAIREGNFSGENRLNAPGARGNMDQLHIQTIFLKQSFLLGDIDTALRAGYRCPVYPDLALRPCAWGKREKDHQSSQKNCFSFHLLSLVLISLPDRL